MRVDHVETALSFAGDASHHVPDGSGDPMHSLIAHHDHLCVERLGFPVEGNAGDSFYGSGRNIQFREARARAPVTTSAVRLAVQRREPKMNGYASDMATGSFLPQTDWTVSGIRILKEDTARGASGIGGPE